MDSREVLTRPGPAPDAVYRYADHAEAVVDWHLPPADAAGSSPLVVLLHGGFWRARYDRTHARPMAGALSRAGCAVANVEYRRVGGEGDLAGGWPVTADDVARAIRRLPEMAVDLGLAADTATLVGHSAGGHLALWLAAQAHPDARPAIQRVVALAPVGDLRAAARAHLGEDAVRDLLGGGPGEVPHHYDAADPVTRLSRPAAQRVLERILVLHGAEDDVVPVRNSRALVTAHPQLTLRELPGVGHFGLIDPLAPAWPTVLHAVIDP